MKFLILISAFLFSFSANASYPYNGSEFRLSSVHRGAISKKSLMDVKQWEISGALLHKKVNDKVSAGGIFELGSKKVKSKLGAVVEYKVNDLLTLGVNGDIAEMKTFGGAFNVHMNLPQNSYVLKPFLTVNHRQLAEAGAVAYFKLSGVPVHIGLAYAPKIGKQKVERLTVFVGSEFVGGNSIFSKLIDGFNKKEG